MKTTLLTALTTAALTAVHADAATFTVTSLFDAGPGTLRGCMEQANNTPGADTITFHPALAGALRPLSTLIISETVTIVGPQSRAISIDASSAPNLFQIFDLNEEIELGLLDLELRDGMSAVYFYDNAKLNIHRCVFRNFGVNGTSATGVFNPTWSSSKSITGTVRSCSFINNRGNYAGVVITVAEPAGEPLEFINCTFCDNSSSNGAGVAWIWNGNTTGQGIISFINCTLTDNHGGDAGFQSGVIENTGTVLACRVKNCVWEGNSAGAGDSPNFTGPSLATSMTMEGVHIFSNAMLAPLQVIDHQHVRIPLPGSPCIDTAYPDAAVLSDQLGKARPFLVPGATPGLASDGSDVGAVERQSGGCGQADINANGRVDGADLSVLLATFGSSCP